MTDFSATVFTVESTGDGFAVRSHILTDLCRQHAEETTTPHGIGPKLHVRNTDLWTWGHCGQFPALVESFGTAEDAEHALLLSWLHDLENSPDVAVYYTRADADSALSDLMGAENE